MTRSINEFLKKGNDEQLGIFQGIVKFLREEYHATSEEGRQKARESATKYFEMAVKKKMYDLEIVENNYTSYTGKELPTNHK